MNLNLDTLPATQATAYSILSLSSYFTDLERRQIDIEERNYLTGLGVVTEMQCDLGKRTVALAHSAISREMQDRLYFNYYLQDSHNKEKNT